MHLQRVLCVQLGSKMSYAHSRGHFVQSFYVDLVAHVGAAKVCVCVKGRMCVVCKRLCCSLVLLAVRSFL